MSKAFTREVDDLPERLTVRRAAFSLPSGAKNYFTAEGMDRLRRELEDLSSAPDSSLVRQRKLQIQESLNSAVAVSSPPAPWTQVLFGATVTVRDEQGEETIYRIVGVEETDIDRNWISWMSPLAKALLKKHVGDRVRFRSPDGDQDIEIVAVQYE
jgi:transcription elongation factor GreB